LTGAADRLVARARRPAIRHRSSSVRSEASTDELPSGAAAGDEPGASAGSIGLAAPGAVSVAPEQVAFAAPAPRPVPLRGETPEPGSTPASEPLRDAPGDPLADADVTANVDPRAQQPTARSVGLPTARHPSPSSRAAGASGGGARPGAAPTASEHSLMAEPALRTPSSLPMTTVVAAPAPAHEPGDLGQDSRRPGGAHPEIVDGASAPYASAAVPPTAGKTALAELLAPVRPAVDETAQPAARRAIAAPITSAGAAEPHRPTAQLPEPRRVPPPATTPAADSAPGLQPGTPPSVRIDRIEIITQTPTVTTADRLGSLDAQRSGASLHERSS